jgi:FtsH-binding integral membrane protein
MGFFAYYNTSSGWCVAYPTSVRLDLNWKAAKVFATMAMTLGAAICFSWIFKYAKVLPDDRFWSMSGILCFFCFSFQGLTSVFAVGGVCQINPANTLPVDVLHLGDGYPNHCEWDDGSMLNILSTVLWWAAGVTSLLLIPPPESVKRSSNRK